MPRECRHFYAAFVLFCFLIGNLGEAQPKPIRQVLIFYELGTTYPGIRLIDQGIRAALHTSPYELEVYREYMDTILFPDPADQQRFRDFYISKYQNRRPDVIITVGPSPLKFMLETHRKAFPGVPIVFLNWVPVSLSLDSDFSGVENDSAPFETIKAALRLQPATRHIVVVGGTSAIDKHFENRAKDQLRPYENNFDISYLTNLTMPDLVARLAHLPSNTIVLFTSFSQDAAGAKFTSGDEASAMVAAGANAPVFSMTDASLNHGEVGGKVSYILEQGRIAGNMAVRMLNGEKPQDVLRVKGVRAYMFDGRALRRWGLKESNLPPGSIVLNQRPGFWELYRQYVLIGIFVLLTQTVAILALLWQRAQKRRTQTALSKSEEKFSKAFHQSPLSFTLASLVDYRLLEVNDTFERYTGWKRDEVIGLTSLQIKFWVDMKQRSTFNEQLRANGAVRDQEILFRKKDGEVRTGIASSALITVNGEPCALSLMADITEAKQAENARRESEQRFRLIANTAPVMIWMTGTDKLCNYVNPPWLEFTGRSLEAELGNGWAEGIHPDDLQVSLDTYTKAFDRRETFNMQFRVRRHDGEYRWIFDIGVPRFEPDDSFAGYIGSCLDITDRKLAEEALSSMSRRLIQAQEQERTRIARELHDDINQRVAILSIELDALEQHPPDSGVELVARMDGIRRRLLELGTEIQGISHRLHSSKLEYLGLAAACRSFCKEAAERHRVTIHFTDEGVPRAVPEDISLCLFRVLQESLTNAIKHSGTQHFEAELRGLSGEIQLSVRDFGVGVDRNETTNGQGLGLISMRERVSLVGGTLLITSKPMGGTEVVARVPLAVVKGASQTTSGAA